MSVLASGLPTDTLGVSSNTADWYFEILKENLEDT